MTSQPPIRLDLTRQKLLIKPDDPLPRFHPPPKAIMVTPIYDYDVQIGLEEANHPRYAYAYGTSNNAHPPSLMYYPTDPTENQRGRGAHHRHSRYTTSTSYSRSWSPPDHAAHSESDSFDRRRPSSSSPPSRHRRHHSPDSRHDNNRRHDSHLHEEDHSHRYSSYPHSYNQPKIRTRERLPDDPIAQHPPDYQVQATHHRPQNAVEHAPSHAVSVHSFGRYSQNTPYPGSDDRLSHSGGGRPPTSASLYEGRSPFYPPGGGAASRPGTHFAPSQVSASAAGGRHPHVVDEVIRSYLKLLPPHPEWMPSKLTGRKKAVCIGINYIGQDKELHGCFNDAKNMADLLITRYKFPQDQVLLLTDADEKYHLPTRKEMFSAFMWLVEGAQPHDSLFLHYSGHGGQSKNADGRDDGMDDTIFPVDFKAEGDIIDDELHDALVNPLPAGCRLTALFDSCHSGTVLDLPYLHSCHGRLRGLHHITARVKQRKSGEKSDVICFAACKDDETSADTFEGGVAVGAMSHAFLQSIERNPQQTYEELLANLRGILVPKYQQKPQISGTYPLDMERTFAL